MVSAVLATVVAEVYRSGTTETELVPENWTGG
jgi:hypothetical protein